MKAIDSDPYAEWKEGKRWVRDHELVRRTRRATLRPDEEPDDDMLTRWERDQRENARQAEEREQEREAS